MKKILNNKLLLIIPLSLIMIISFLSMYNAKFISSLYHHNLEKQIIWYLLGILCLIIMRKINYKFIIKYSFVFYILSLILLIYVLLYGNNINGAKAWIKLGSISIQPSEIMKLSLSIYLSSLSFNFKSKGLFSEFKYILKLVIITLIPSVLVFLEPDTGAIIFYLLILFMSLLLSDIHRFWLFIAFFIFGLGIIFFVFLYLFNKDILINLIGTSFFYRVERLITFKTMSSYQLDNALISIGASKFFNFNLGQALIYIPEAPTDFIFAFSIGNFGYFVGILLLLSYFLILVYLINKYFNQVKSISKNILGIFILLLSFGIIYNIAMNLGLLPIMGIPLPFLSYGGSTLITYFIFLGLVK